MADLLEILTICLLYSILLYVEAKQVLDDGNNFAMRQKPSRPFTAAQARDQSMLSQYVRKDKAYTHL